MRWLALLLMALPLLAAANTSDSADGTATQSSQWVQNLMQGCWACGAFNTVSAIGLSLADQVFDQLASGMTLLIGLYIAMWLLLFAAKLFFPFGPEQNRGSWNEGAAKLFRLMLVLAFLQGSGPFWNYVFIPVISAAMGLASQMATAADGFEGQWGTTESGQGGSTDYCSGQAPSTGVTMSGDSASAAQAMAQMDCPISRIQSQFGKGIVIGFAVMSKSTCSNSFRINPLPSIEGLLNSAAGLLLIIIFGVGYIVFPFLLIDVVMRVSLVAATSPLLIAATMSRTTIGMSQRGIWSLMQCGLTLMFGATIAGIGKATIAFALTLMPIKSGYSLQDWAHLTSALEDPCKSGLSLGFGSAGFYILAGTGVILIFMMRRAGSLATEITNVASDTVGAQAGFAFLAGKVAQGAGAISQAAYKRAVAPSSGKRGGNRDDNRDKGGTPNRNKADQVNGK